MGNSPEISLRTLRPAVGLRSFAATWVEVALLVFVVWVMVGKHGL